MVNQSLNPNQKRKFQHLLPHNMSKRIVSSKAILVPIKTKKERAIFSYLPPEIWEEILLRLPIKTLLICTSVCKDWKSLINSQSFIKQFANNANVFRFLELRYGSNGYESPRAPTRYDKVFSIYSDTQLLDDDYLPISKLAPKDQAYCNDSQVIGTCNGLVCLSNPCRNYDTFILMKSPIKKYLVLPKSTAGPKYYYWRCTMSGFYFDSKNNDFIVVKVSLRYRIKTIPWVELYSLNTGKWRSIRGRGLSMRFSPACVNTRDQMLFVNGSLHWLVSGKVFDRGDREHIKVILSFDLSTETSREFLLPSCLALLSQSNLFLLKGGVNTLALLHKKPSGFNIWVMEKYGNVDSWVKILNIHSPGYIARVIMRNTGEMVAEMYREYNFRTKDLLKSSVLQAVAEDLYESWWLTC